MTANNANTSSYNQKPPRSKLKILVVLLIIGIPSYFFLIKPRLFKSAPTSPPAASEEVELNAAVIKIKSIQIAQELPGRVNAFKFSEIRPQVEGVILEQTFTEGTFVKKGHQLYKINPTLYRATYSEAKANYKTLKAKKKRFDQLVSAGAVSKQEYDDLIANLEQASSTFQKAELNLRYSRVNAPISGYIGKSNVTPGTLVTANQAEVLTTITQLSPIYVDVVQPSADAIKQGDQKNIKVSIIVDGVEKQETGHLQFSEMFADKETDSVRLRAKFLNADHALLPGMFVNAKLYLKPIDAITVPQKITSRAPDGSLMLWVIEDGIAKPRKIIAEKSFEDQWIVTDGLKEGDIILLEGFLKIHEGSKVKPIIAEDQSITVEKDESNV